MQQVQKTLKILAIVFTAVCLVMAAIGGVVYAQSAAWRRTALPVEAMITGYGRGESYTIEYEVNGVTYDGVLHYSESGMRVGRPETIYVNPDDPADFRDRSADIVALVMLILAGAFLIPAAILWFIYLRGRKREAYLRGQGTEVVAQIIDVQPTNIRVNNARTYAIQCSWENPQDDTTYIFRSAALTYNPAALLQERGITTLPVLIDPYNPKRYFVDLSALEERTVVL